MKTLLSILGFIPIFLASQIQGQCQPKLTISQKGTINWYPVSKATDFEGKSTDFLSCEACGTSTAFFKVPVKSEFFKGKEVQSCRFKTSKWVEIPFWQISGVDTSASFSVPSFGIEKYEIERSLGSRVKIKLIRKNNQIWEKLESFELEANYTEINRPAVSALRTTTDENSFLSQGQWVKVGIVNSGVYSISAAELAPFGLDLVGKNSSLIRMFGNGGKMLSEAKRDYNFGDMDELAIKVLDGGDGIFGDNDRVLFYGQEPETWNFDPATRTYAFKKNIYSDTSYYFITYSNEPGKRIANQPAATSPAVVSKSSFPERWIYSPDKVNVRSIGRDWYADVLDFTTSKDINFEAAGLLNDSLVKIRYQLMARSGVAYPFNLSAGGLSLPPNITPPTINLNGAAILTNYGNISAGTRSFTPAPGSGAININVLYDKQGNTQSLGYIDFIEANGYRSLAWRNQNFGFRSNSLLKEVAEFNLPGFPSNGEVWNVTNPSSATIQNIQNQRFSILDDTLLEFFAFTTSNLPKPLSYSVVQSQNLRGMAVPDLLIVAHPSFLIDANRLADFRRDFDGLDVEVVTPAQIYNEFSSGSQDITAIRNFAMHLYYKSPDPKLKYLLLFGDCSYDYKDRITNNTNYVPVYQSTASMNLYQSYASDDYYGILARTRGSWEVDENIDIGVGRLPAKTAQEAKAMVDKLKHYASSGLTLGDWRNQYTFVADNGDGCLHSSQADELSDILLLKNSNGNLKKVYLGAYEQVASPGGYTSPTCTNELINTINNGSLVVNYTGHGGETVWADEFLFTSEMAEGLTNINNLPFFVTATCDFGRHDYPTQTSGAESLVLNPNGGAIGIMTTGRPVESYSNLVMNTAFYNSLFRSLSGRMGDVQRLTKNLSSSKFSNRGFTLLGDPSARFAFPQDQIVINGLTGEDTIKGLELVELSGEIQKGGIKNSTFNGKADIILYDRPNTLAVKESPTSPRICNYDYQKNILYKGSVNVTSGDFLFKFFVSKDVSFDPGKGRIILYAKDTFQRRDANGSKFVNIGGINPNPRLDTKGPDIKLFMNDKSFIDYGLVGKDADLLVFLEDDSSGINVSGLGLGHNLTATLDDNEVYILNEYFQNDVGSYTKGSARYPLKNLSPGMHQIKVKGWDSFNNSSERAINFEVGIAEINGLVAKEIKFYPNPSFNEFYLELQNAYAGEEIEIKLVVYDIVGNQITDKVWIYDNSIARPGAFKELAWDGLRSDGTKLPGGTYFCKVAIKSNTDGAGYKINKKLILLR